MTIKSDLIALLGILPSLSGVTCSLWYSALLEKGLISLLGLDWKLKIIENWK